MSATFSPRQVDPGWWKRWPKEALGLFLRSPLAFLFAVLIAFGLAFVPQTSIVAATLSFLLAAFVMSIARSADHHAGRHLWSVFRSGLFDAVRLAWNIFFYLAAFFCVISAIHWATDGSWAVSAHSVTSARLPWMRLPHWLRQAFLNAENDQSSSLLPWPMFMVYIALSVGHPWFYTLYEKSTAAMFINIDPSMAFSALGFSTYCFQTFVHRMVSMDAVLWSIAAVAVLNVTMGIFAYIFAREVFDGQKRNIPVPRVASVPDPALASEPVGSA